MASLPPLLSTLQSQLIAGDLVLGGGLSLVRSDGIIDRLEPACSQSDVRRWGLAFADSDPRSELVPKGGFTGLLVLLLLAGAGTELRPEGFGSHD